jgi:O-antigen ligase
MTVDVEAAVPVVHESMRTPKDEGNAGLPTRTSQRYRRTWRAAILPDRDQRQVPRSVVIATVVAIAGMPLLVPAGPGNTGLADVGITVCILLTLGCAVRGGWQFRLPYALPVLLFTLAGAAALLSVSAPPGIWIVLLQDLFTLLWACSLANLARDPRALRVILSAWAWSALAWAALMLIGVFTKQAWLSGVSARNGSRASLTFGDANLAAGYFVSSLLILRAARVPAARPLRYLACALLITAVVFTGSNGGFLALAAGTAAGCVLRLRRRSTAVATSVGCLLALSIGLAATHVDEAAIRSWAQQQAPVLRDSIGRSGASSESRGKIANESLQLWRHDSLWGIGPTLTKETLEQQQAPYPKESHDDYAAALIERGVLGAVALALLLAVAWRRLAHIATASLSPAYTIAVPRPELLAAAGIGYLISGFFYEVLHFRHLWALLGISAGLDLWGRRS